MIGHETRIDLRLVDDGEVDRLQKPGLGGGDGEVIFDIDDIPGDIAAVDHGFELAVIGRSVLQHIDARSFRIRISPGFLLGVLSRSAPAREHHVIGIGGKGRRHRKGGGDDEFLDHCILHGRLRVLFLLGA